jgi:hypothetical protein
VAGNSGCAGGSQSDTFMLTVLSCAKAGVTLAAISMASNAGLIVIPPQGLMGLLHAQFFNSLQLQELQLRLTNSNRCQAEIEVEQ